MCSRVTFSKSCSRGVVQMPPNSTAAGLMQQLLVAFLEVEGGAMFGAGKIWILHSAFGVKPKDIQHRLFTRRPPSWKTSYRAPNARWSSAGIRRLEGDEAPEIVLDAVSAQGARGEELRRTGLFRASYSVQSADRTGCRPGSAGGPAPRRRISGRCRAPCNVRPGPG